MGRNHTIRGIYCVRLASRWQHCEYKGRGRNTMHGGGLHKKTVHRWHGFAAMLSVMTVRRARHRIATLHRLFGRRRGTALECICRERDRQYHQKNWLSQTHH
jgi:hypothetical protein